MRAATAVATTNAACRAAVRTSSEPPVPANRRRTAGSGRRPRTWGRASASTQRTYSAAPTHWAATVEAAEAPMPKPSPYTRITSSTRFPAAVSAATFRGRAMSSPPRR